MTQRSKLKSRSVHGRVVWVLGGLTLALCSLLPAAQQPLEAERSASRAYLYHYLDPLVVYPDVQTPGLPCIDSHFEGKLRLPAQSDLTPQIDPAHLIARVGCQHISDEASRAANPMLIPEPGSMHSPIVVPILHQVAEPKDFGVLHGGRTPGNDDLVARHLPSIGRHDPLTHRGSSPALQRSSVSTEPMIGSPAAKLRPVSRPLPPVLLLPLANTSNVAECAAVDSSNRAERQSLCRHLLRVCILLFLRAGETC